MVQWFVVVFALLAALPAHAAAPSPCGFELAADGATPTQPACPAAGSQSLGPVEPYVRTQLVYGITNSSIIRDDITMGPYNICVPIAKNTSVDNNDGAGQLMPRLYKTVGGVTSPAGLTLTPSLTPISGDANADNLYCVAFGSDRDTLDAGDSYFLATDILFNPFSAPQARFFEDTPDPGYALACGQTGANPPVCYAPVDLASPTVDVNSYTAVIDGCGFDLIDPASTPTTPSCQDSPGAQSLGPIDPNTTHTLVYGGGVPRGATNATLAGVFNICLPLPIGLTTANERIYHTDSAGNVTQLESRDVVFQLQGTNDGTVQGDFCAAYSGPQLMAPEESIWVAVDVTFGSTEVTFADAGGIEGMVNTDCSMPGGNGTVCPTDNIPELTVTMNQYNAVIDGCGFDLVTGAATTPSCQDSPGAQTLGPVDPNSTHTLVWGGGVPRGATNATIAGVFDFCFPLPLGVTTGRGDLYHTDGSGNVTDITADATFALDTSTADAVSQGDFCVTYDGAQLMAPEETIWATVEVTFGTNDAVFVDNAGDDGRVMTDCSLPGGNGMACPIDNLPALTVDVTQYDAVIDGCGFELVDTGVTATTPTCQDSPGAQTLGPVEPNSTHQLVFGAGVPRGATNATLAGVFSQCFPLPLGVTAGRANLYHTDASGNVTDISADATFALDTGSADSASQGEYCVTYDGSQLMAPEETIWASVEVTFGLFDAHFVDASNNDGWVGTDCSLPGGNGMACPIDNLADLTVQVTDYTEAIYGCGYTLVDSTSQPTLPVCADNPAAQTLGPVEPNSTSTLIFGAGVPAGKSFATLAGIFKICAPLPTSVSTASPRLWHTDASANTVEITSDVAFALDTSTADTSTQGDYCATYSGAELLEPGETLWVTVDVTVGMVDAVFVDDGRNPGRVMTDCSLPGGNGSTCPVGDLADMTIDVTEYTAVIDGCGFQLIDTTTTATTPSCSDNPGAQTLGSIAANSTHTLVYGAGVPRGSTNATLPGIFKICLPLPLGLSTANPELFHTDSGGTTTALTSDVTFALDTSTADSAVQGDYCATYDGRTLLAPEETLWMTLDVTFGTSTVTFVDASNDDGRVQTDCSLPGGNGSLCPVDNLAALTVTIDAVAVNTDQGAGNPLMTDEGGATDTVTFTLSRLPTDTVSFTVSSSDTTEGTVDGNGVVTLDSSNWDTGVTVTVRGVDDDFDDDTISFALQFTAITSNDTEFANLTLADMPWENADDDTAGVTVTPTAITTSEAATNGTFDVVLTAAPMPTTTATINLSGLDTTEGTLSTTSLSFDQNNWSTAQTVTVTGVADNIVDGDQTYTLGLDPIASGDSAFSGLDPDDVSITNTDINSTDFIVDIGTGGGGSMLVTSEDLTTDIFTMALDGMPSDDVTVTFTLDGTEGSVSPTSLTFTSSNWSTPQTVTLTGVDDALIDGDIDHDITATTSSNDTQFTGLSDTIPARNTDNDGVEFVVDIGTGGGGTRVMTAESGSTDIFTIALNALPSDDVTMTFTLDATEGSVSPASLTFTSSNGTTAQTVTVTGVDDDLVDGDIDYDITVTTASNDTLFDALTDDVPATNTDDDVGGVVVNDGRDDVLMTSEDGGEDSFDLVLSSEPSSDVTFSFVSDDDTEAETDVASVTFTAANWDQTQTVTVLGVDDDEVDGDMPFVITVTSSSSDTAFDALSADIDGENLDDDEALDTDTDTDSIDQVKGDKEWVQGGCNCDAASTPLTAGWLVLLGLSLVRRRA